MTPKLEPGKRKRTEGLKPLNAVLFYLWTLAILLVTEGQTVFMVFGVLDRKNNSSGFQFHSVSDEFDLSSEKYKLSMITSFQLFGMIFAYWVAGTLSDTFGRRKTLIPLFISANIAIWASNFAPNWMVYTIARFLIGFCCAGAVNVATVMLSEQLPSKAKACLITLPYPLSHVYLGILACFARDWVTLSWWSTIPSLLVILAASLVVFPDENGSHGFEPINGEAGVCLPIDCQKRHGSNILKFMIAGGKAPMFATIAAGWFVTALNFFSMLYSVGNIYGNPAENLIYVELVRLAILLVLLFLEKGIKLSRKTIYVGGLCYLILCYVAIIVRLGVDQSESSVVRVACIAGTAAPTVLFGMLMVMTTDSLVADCRNTGYGIMVSISRFGGVISTYVFLLQDFGRTLPYAFLLGTVIVTLALTLCFVPKKQSLGDDDED